MKKPFVERRKTHRVEARVPIQLEQREEQYRGEIIPAESANLSEGGVYCQVGKYLPPLTKVAITLLLPAFGGKRSAAREIKAEAVVVRSLPEKEGRKVLGYRIACAFTTIGEEDRGFVREYIIWRLLAGMGS
ncbi:MAG: PilZ domain-containing protein [Candidatus Eiseniibacteriota bacterium]|nr:MAG: PilZ domain-containing protein [Candidatus Eisenbacteria bacterium]